MITIPYRLLAAALWLAAPLTAQRYDPLALPTAKLAPPIDLTIRDAARQRDIPIRVYLPATTAAAPVVLFSHGLGGSRENNAYLGTHWAARGYVVVAMQHIGSDESVWKEISPVQRLAALKQAASTQNLLLRFADRLAVYPALPPGRKYEVVLDGAQHMAFGDTPERGRGARNPAHHVAIQALSTAFWDAYLKNDPAAKAWLDGDGPRTVLQPRDTWQHR